jgi:very-short-patch-repair endonuclease
MAGPQRRQFTASERSDIASRYSSGVALGVLAREYHCAASTIRMVLADAGVAVRTQHEAFHLRIRASGFVNTPIELRMHDALKVAGIGFTTQSLLLGRYLVDILIHQVPVVVEADGIVHVGRKQRAKDALRDAALTAAGYHVFRFTGAEINTNAVECVNRLIAACGLTRDREPVYDIRTSFAGPDHPRWKGGNAEFTCDNCGDVFTRPPKHRTGEHTFCKQACYGEWLHKHPDINHHRRRRAQRDWTGLAELYAAGMSIKQLGVRFGCSNRAITSAMRDLGIPIRPMGGHRVKGGFYASGIAPPAATSQIKIESVLT